MSMDGNLIGKLDHPVEIDLKIITMAKFAVDGYNKNKKATLEFVEVMKATATMMVPSIYTLTLEATGGLHTKMYVASVEEKPNKDLPPYDTGLGWMAWHQIQTLLDFNPVGGCTHDHENEHKEFSCS